MLTINISEIIWTIFNFFLLFFILRHFLYKPVTEFMDKRSKCIEEKMEIEKHTQAALEENRICMEQGRKKALEDAEALVAEAKAEKEQRGKSLVQQARDQSALNRNKAAISAAMKNEQEKNRMDNNVQRLAAVLAETLLDINHA